MDELLEVRKKKLAALRALGIEPYGESFPNKEPIAELRAAHAAGKAPGRVRTAGRLMALRIHGKSVFGDIRDASGKIQIYLKSSELGDEKFKLVHLLDIGDILGVEGELFVTRMGELTINVKEVKVLTKGLRSLPEKWHGLTDVETRHRHRHLDMIANPEVAATFVRRSEMIREIRRFLDERGFLEVETPIMQPIAGGAAARPFITHHNALDIDLYMRVSPELYLKRLLVGGMERVYELGRNFRNEGISTKHNPEFSMLELYQACADYTVMMELTEGLIGGLIGKFRGGTRFEFAGHEIDTQRPWKRITYTEAIAQYAGIDWRDADAALRKGKELEIDCSARSPIQVVGEIFERTVEERLVHPTFVLDYPAALCPLAKRKAGEPDVAERFELFIGGIEIANAYSELADPEEQYANFLRQAEQDPDARPDEEYVGALQYGMPPAGGLGIGIDRLAMVVLNGRSIRDVILFPLLRPQPPGGAGRSL